MSISSAQHRGILVPSNGAPSRRIDLHLLESGEVDDDGAIPDAVPGHRVPAAPDGDPKPFVGGEGHRSDDVGEACAPDDEKRAPARRAVSIRTL